MMEIVAPLGIQTVTAQFRLVNHPHVVQIAFGYNMDPASEHCSLAVDRLAQFLKDVPGTEIVDAVDGVQPKCINMVFGDPVQGV